MECCVLLHPATTKSLQCLHAADTSQEAALASSAPTSQAVKGRWDRQEPVAQLALKQEPTAESMLKQESEGEPMAQEAEAVKEEHAAHAAAFSLEAVMEAQSALINERHQKPQPNMTEDERKAHRRR